MLHILIYLVLTVLISGFVPVSCNSLASFPQSAIDLSHYDAISSAPLPFNTHSSTDTKNKGSFVGRKYLEARIANGKPAADNKFPYVASVALWGIHTCGASLIAPRVVLTAAHCVWDADYKTVRDPTSVAVTLGNPTLTYGQKFNVDRIVIPAQFDSSRNYFGDIAILQLSSAASTTKTIKLEQKYKQSKQYTAIGWGQTSNNNSLASTLQYTYVNGMSKPKCIAALVKFNLGVLPADHFCAGLNANKADTCRGDSGGPLLAKNTPIQSGITSYGPEESICGGTENLGVYTSVGYWYPWIQDTLSLYNMKGKVPPNRLNTPLFNQCSALNVTGSNSGGGGSSDNSKSSSEKKTTTSGQCCDSCRSMKTCTAWTWIKVGKVCRLMTAKSGYTFYANNDCHSGTMT